jgi:anti-sigma regulatory factor (Ser/Thr protein kinase)
MAPDTLQPHRLTLASSRAASGEASAWARGLAAAAGLVEDTAYALDLCVVEIVSNVVDHSYRNGPGEIRLSLGVDAHGAIVSVIDDGPAFDPLTVPAPAMAASLEEASVGGLGIQMVRATAGGCRYERRAGSNVFTAWFGKVSGQLSGSDPN